MKESIKNSIKEILLAPSCFPEEKRKSYETRENELFEWYEKYGEVNTCYNLYGMDRIASPPNDEWLDRKVFRKQRHDINAMFYPPVGSFPYDYTLFMRDKDCFELLMQRIFGNSDKFVRSYGIFMNKKLYANQSDGNRIEISQEDLIKHFEGKRIVIKETYGASGKEVLVVSMKNGMIEDDGKRMSVNDYLLSISKSNSFFLIQDYIVQHPFMMNLNTSSVNTLRILTYNTGKQVYVANAVVRFGKSGSKIDNCDLGGNLVGTGTDGKLLGDKFNFLDKTRESNPFQGETIPFFAQAVELARTAHLFIPQVFTIGWDLILTENGPKILEGNDGWEPYVSQMPQGFAQRKNWNAFLKERREYFKD